jgi:hypothetical protein
VHKFKKHTRNLIVMEQDYKFKVIRIEDTIFITNPKKSIYEDFNDLYTLCLLRADLEGAMIFQTVIKKLATWEKKLYSTI